MKKHTVAVGKAKPKSKKMKLAKGVKNMQHRSKKPMTMTKAAKDAKLSSKSLAALKSEIKKATMAKVPKNSTTAKNLQHRSKKPMTRTKAAKDAKLSSKSLAAVKAEIKKATMTKAPKISTAAKAAALKMKVIKAPMKIFWNRNDATEKTLNDLNLKRNSYVAAGNKVSAVVQKLVSDAEAYAKRLKLAWTKAQATAAKARKTAALWLRIVYGMKGKKITAKRSFAKKVKAKSGKKTSPKKGKKPTKHFGDAWKSALAKKKATKAKKSQKKVVRRLAAVKKYSNASTGLDTMKIPKV